MGTCEHDECLRELGISEELIEKYNKGNNQTKLKILIDQRKVILEGLHTQASLLSCIDYIINEVKKAE